jgi:hypothetical protein
MEYKNIPEIEGISENSKIDTQSTQNRNGS